MINHFYWLALQNGTCTHKWNSLGISYNCQSMFESGQSPIDVVDSKLMGAAQAAAPPPPASAAAAAEDGGAFHHHSHRRLNFHLKCDWDVIVSSIGLLLLLSCCGTESIPFYLYRTRHRLTERQSPQNDHRCVILQLLPLKFPCLLFHITLCRAWLEWSEFCYVLPSPLAS